MTHLVKWQLISMISRFAAMGAGIAQGIFVVRLLSTTDYGLVGVVTAIGSLAGILMHLGLVSGATREIAAAGKKETFKIFISALLARMAIALPIFLVLFFGASPIASKVYDHPEVTNAVRLYAVILLIQAPQGIFNAALSGLKRFKSVFIFQVVIALTSLAIYVPLIWKLQFYGYFWAMLALAGVHTGILFFLTARCFYNFNAFLPAGQRNPKSKGLGFGISATEVKTNLRRIFSVGLSLYLVKIIFTLWQRFGPLVLGRTASAAEVGIFNFALFYSTKLMTASDAITDVNLPVFSGKFLDGLDEFKTTFLANFQKIYAFITLTAISAIYWSPELVRLVVGHKYNSSLRLIPWLIGAFWCYSFINIIKSSLMIPAKLNRDMVISYLLLLIGTVGGFYISRHSELWPKANQSLVGVSEPAPNWFRGSPLNPLQSMALGMLAGGVLALAYQWHTIHRTLNLNILTRHSLALVISLIPLTVPYCLSFNLGIKTAVFATVLFLFAYLSNHFQIITWKQVWKRAK